MLSLSNKRKIMKILIDQNLEGFRKGDEKSKYPQNTIRVETIAKKSNIDIDTTFLIIRELWLSEYISIHDRGDQHTLWKCMITPKGYFEFKNGWKRYIKELLLLLAASTPFISLLIYFINGQ